MQLEISPEIRAATTKCLKGFLCLTQPETMCQVHYCVNGMLHFLQSPDQGPCPYLRYFGNKPYCECPTRREIFNRYKR